MRNEALWKPGKYVVGPKGLEAPKGALIGSRLAIDLVGGFVGAALNANASGRLLDLGCGTVPFYQAYRPHVTQISCLDWPNSRHAIDHADMEHDLTQPLPFDDGSFDTILLSDVLEHLPEPERLWHEMARVLAPSGKAIINVPFLYWLHETPHDYYRYTEYALKRFAERAGFRILELTPIGGPFDVIADLASKSIGRRRWGKPIAALLQGLAHRLSRPSRRMPLAYGMVVQKP